MAIIDKPSDYFETLTWSGNSTDDRAISGLDFAPNWVWIKCRNNGQNHNIFDTVRGATESLESNNSNAENTDSTSLKSFTSDGYTLGTGSTVNSSSPSTKTYVGWNWKAGGTASSNTDGSITSSVSANTTSGFSIVSYTGNGSAGATIGHGLGVIPKMIIVKGRDTASNWQVGHSSLGWTQSIRLNQTGASASRTISWNDTDPTSSVFSVGTDSDCNTNTDNYIAYCFAEKKGFSKFGSYTGNGSTDGTFVYTGFKPAWVMVKTTGDNSWLIFDNKRSTFNLTQKYLYADASDAENDASTQGIDILSNGFKSRNSNTGTNQSGTTYIYMCFAENPLVSSAGVPCTAR